MKNSLLKWHSLKRSEMDIFNRLYTDPYNEYESNPEENITLSLNVQYGLNKQLAGHNSNVFVLDPCNDFDLFNQSKLTHVIPNIKRMNASFIVFDFNGRIFDAVSSILKEKGYKIKIINLCNPQNGNHYNPLEYIESIKDFDVFTDSFLRQKGDPVCRNLLKALIFYVKQVEKKEMQTLSHIHSLLSMGSCPYDTLNVLCRMFEALEQKYPLAVSVQIYDAFKSYSVNLQTYAVTTLLNKLEPFSKDNYKNLTNFDDLNLTDLNKSKQALFFIYGYQINCYSLISAACQQFLYDACKAEYYYHKSGDTVRTHIFFDAHHFFHYEIESYLSISPRYGITWSILATTLDPLRHNTHRWDEICKEVPIWLIFNRINNQDDREYVSKKVGIKKINLKSSKEERLISPDELLNLPYEKCIVIIEGNDPFLDYVFDEKSTLDQKINKNPLRENKTSKKKSHIIQIGPFTFKF